MTCLADGRDRCQEIKATLERDPRVAAVDTLAPSIGPRPDWVIEVVVRADDAVPPAITHAMTERGLGLVDVSPRGPDHYVIVGVSR